MSRILERKIKSYLKNYYKKVLKEENEEDEIQPPDLTNITTKKQIKSLRNKPVRGFDDPNINPFSPDKDPDARYRKHRALVSDENSALDIIDKVKRYGMSYEIGCIREKANKNNFIWFLYKKGLNAPKIGSNLDTQSLSSFKKVPHIIRDRSRDGEFRVFNPMVMITSPNIEAALMKHVSQNGPITGPIIRHVDFIDKQNLTIVSREKSLDNYIDYEKIGIEDPKQKRSLEVEEEYQDVIDAASPQELEDNQQYEARIQKLNDDLESAREDLINLNQYIKNARHLPKKTPQDREEFQKNLDAKENLETYIQRLSDQIKYSKPPKRSARTYKRNYTINTALQDDIDYKRYGIVEYLGFSRKADAESLHRHYVRFAHKMLERGPDSESNVALSLRSLELKLNSAEGDKFIVDNFPVEDPELSIENVEQDDEIRESLEAYKEVLSLACELAKLEEWISIESLASSNSGSGSPKNVKKVFYHVKQDIFSLYEGSEKTTVNLERLKDANGIKELTVLLAYIGLVTETNKLRRAFKIKSQRSPTQETLNALQKLKAVIGERQSSLSEYEFTSAYGEEDDTLGVVKADPVTDPSEAYPEDILNGIAIVRRRLETIKRFRKESKEEKKSKPKK